jgi:dipeptidyl-peptidase-4
MEKDDAWLNLHQSFPKWLDDGSGFFWFTERNGAPEVELRKPDGSLASSWVKPDVGFKEIVGWDPKGRWLYFTASSDPTQALLHRVQEGKPPERIHTGAGRPALQSGQLSRDGSLLQVRTVTLDQAPRYTLHRADGTLLAELPASAVAPPFQPQVEIRKVGKTEGTWAAITRPRNLEKGKKLPVIVEVYAGPTIGFVHHAMLRYLRAQWLADQGFIVVRVDGRGAPGRGRDWERQVWGDFSSLVDDQAAAVQALAAEVPEMDATRVGITGWSFGGYMSALAVLRRPDVFKAAVAGAPVTDWTDYDTHCTERMLGLPQENPKGYEKSSLLTYANRLERPLLLVHGTADDNVYFQHSLKLSDALFRAGKPHEVLPLGGQTHMVRDPVAMQRLEESTVRFFKRHL